MSQFKAAIFDLDGVITSTAAQHKKAWACLFEAYNDYREQEGKNTFEAYDPDKDYPEYLDGKPRLDGLESFLASRQIELPRGTKDDTLEDETLQGLGNYKNAQYRKLIKEEGVNIYEKTLDTIKEWRQKGIKTGIISSSKNCKFILESVGLDHFFDVRLDGTDLKKDEELKGKPAPDMFLKASETLNVHPRHAIVVEDSIAGIHAGKRGEFKYVIGISHAGNEEQLKQEGADYVVEHLAELDKESQAFALPSFFEHAEEVKKNLMARPVALFLDFDGTLAPIVEEPDQAKPLEGIADILEDLQCKTLLTAAISGRGLKDLQSRLHSEHLYYAGSHGFEIAGPDGYEYEIREAQDVLPILDKVEQQLNAQFGQTEGVFIERKKYAIACHYRQAGPSAEQELKSACTELAENHKELKLSAGKKIFELKPRLDWDKGRALEHLIHLLDLDKTNVYPIYLGDDLTDEDAFGVISSYGLPIYVGESQRLTNADYQLKSPQEVKHFLLWLFDVLNQKS